MKRDMDLVRRIMQDLQEREDPPGGLIRLNYPDIDKSIVAQHVQIRAEGGLIEARNLTSSSGFDWRPVRLTWEGHEFLASASNPSVWKRAKDKVMESGGDIAISVLKALLISLSKEQLGIK